MDYQEIINGLTTEGIINLMKQNLRKCGVPVM
jgi:hypothetical protein